MSAIWSSSERPLSVRTVWVGGIRHVVLSPDDPLINTKNKYQHRRPHTSKGNEFSQSDYQQLKSPGLDSLSNCFVDLSVMVEKDDRGSSKMILRQSVPPCGRLLSGDSGRSFKYCPAMKDIKKHLTLEHQSVEDFRIEIKSIDERWNNTSNDYYSSSSNVDKFEFPEIRSNLLSERVLQWLDLSGKVQNYVRDDVQDVGKSLNMEEQRSNKQDISLDKRKMQNYKLVKGRKPECLERSERRMTRRKLFEIDECAKKNDSFEIDEHFWIKSTIEKEENDLSKVVEKQEEKEKEEKEKEEKEEKSFTNFWSSVGRPQLHIFMPKLNCNEKIRASSQESLVCD
ncbi:hypothetical protein M0804_010656 [Polistes exclamans]|nr:hypothetical protein M0804_010656 [Polistes exclamans]